jgi:putative oxygen-independent coproporphyrinogen III oxidase
VPRLPDGDPAPRSGELPTEALATLAGSRLGMYVHVPFCAVRCGYCDFNTYTLTELGPGASTSTFVDSALAELDLATTVLGMGAGPVDTIFVGGGTPTLLPAADLVRCVDGIRERFGLAPDAEVTTESNPDSVEPAALDALRAGGINRISFGMQSAEPHVLRVLDRTHDPARVPQVVSWARSSGFEQVSVDLIYGTPGETVAGWQHSVETALALEPDHVSAYALIVEEGTALARAVARGEVPATDDDDLADKYERVDDLLSGAGLQWYEVSNWARGAGSRSRHNLGYWQGANWWGVGPGAHSHVEGVRWWNVKHPAAYAQRISSHVSPAAAREMLDAETRRVERVLLETRLASGLGLGILDAAGRAVVPELLADGLVTLVSPEGSVVSGEESLVLTRRGRLLADAVVRALLP